MNSVIEFLEFSFVYFAALFLGWAIGRNRGYANGFTNATDRSVRVLRENDRLREQCEELLAKSKKESSD